MLQYNDTYLNLLEKSILSRMRKDFGANKRKRLHTIIAMWGHILLEIFQTDSSNEKFQKNTRPVT